MIERVLVVLTVVGVATAAWLAFRRRLTTAQRMTTGDRVPADLVDPSSPATFVLVTTRRCAACGPVEERLRTHHPNVRVVKVDAERRPDQARALRVRSVPTLVEAGADGRVRGRAAGPAAVHRYLDVQAATAAVGIAAEPDDR